MIGRLRGTLLEKEPPRLIVEASGVGYVVEAPMSTFYSLPALGDAVDLRIHTRIREDTICLYGFATEAERRMFAALLRVSGVGARVALLMLSGMAPHELWQCISEGDLQRLSQIPGIGRKTAQRVVLELRDHLGRFSQRPGDSGQAEEGPRREAVVALMELGYSGDRAEATLQAVTEPGLGVEELLRRSLQRMVR